MKHTLRYLLIASATTVGALLFLLAAASGDSQLFDSYYAWILGANISVGIALLLVVLFLLGRLYSRYRRGRFGSKLMTRMVLMFSFMGIVPVIVIYLVSVQFVSRSIESWFNVQVESALESGLNLGRAALESSLKDLQLKAVGVAGELSEMSDSLIAIRLPRIIDRNQLQDTMVVSASQGDRQLWFGCITPAAGYSFGLDDVACARNGQLRHDRWRAGRQFRFCACRAAQAARDR